MRWPWQTGATGNPLWAVRIQVHTDSRTPPELRYEAIFFLRYYRTSGMLWFFFTLHYRGLYPRAKKLWLRYNIELKESRWVIYLWQCRWERSIGYWCGFIGWFMAVPRFRGYIYRPVRCWRGKVLKIMQTKRFGLYRIRAAESTKFKCSRIGRRIELSGRIVASAQQSGWE